MRDHLPPLLFCLQFVVKREVVQEEEEEDDGVVKKKEKKKTPSILVKCKMAVLSLGHSAPHTKCSALKCINGRMQFGTQLMF